MGKHVTPYKEVHGIIYCSPPLHSATVLDTSSLLLNLSKLFPFLGLLLAVSFLFGAVFVCFCGRQNNVPHKHPCKCVP